MLIMHVGKHKAGSSSIQHFFAQNQAQLERRNVIYPSIGRKKSAHHLLKNQLTLKDSSYLVRGGFAELRKLISSNPDRTVFISSEGFESLKQQEIKELQQELSPSSPLILFYIREFSSHVVSRYNQLTKKGINIDDFDTFFNQYGPSDGVAECENMRTWAELFGWENLRIRSLDPESLTGGSLIEDVLSVMGLRLSEFGGSDAPGLDARNVSIGWKTTELLRALYGELSKRVGTDPLNEKRIQRDAAHHVRKCCLRTISELGLGAARTEYISAPQRERCRSSWAAHIAELNKFITGVKLSHVSSDESPPERPFMPALIRIPQDEREQIADRLSQTLFVRDSIKARSAEWHIDPEVRERFIRLVRIPGG